MNILGAIWRGIEAFVIYVGIGLLVVLPCWLIGAIFGPNRMWEVIGVTVILAVIVSAINSLNKGRSGRN